MSVDTNRSTGLVATEEEVREIVRQELERARRRDSTERRACIIASKGTLDWAYPPLILGSAAAAAGMDVAIFFTFYGLNIIHKTKGKKLAVAPLANPAMPMPVPNLIGAIPGMTSMATTMMKKQFKGKGVASIDELLQNCIDLGVRLMPCQMTVDVFGYKQADFIPEAEPGCGAAAFIRFASEADVSLFV